MMAATPSSFASPQDAARAVPLRGWTSVQKSLLARHIHGMHAAWCRDWGVPVPLPGQIAVGEAEEAFSLAEDVRLADALHCALFFEERQEDRWRASGATHGIRVALDLVQHAADAWHQAVGRHFGWLSTDAGAARAPQAFALDGSLQVAIPMAQKRLRFALGAEMIQAALSRAEDGLAVAAPGAGSQDASLECVVDALRTHMLHLSVHLASTTITLGELDLLEPGDVIALRHGLTEPLTIKTPDGSVLGTAWLGQSGGRLAVRLHPPAPISTSPDAAHQH
jgi:flagellar motor switch/type III secretory pathway protein FliN